jgi:superfamily II DNA or RNA helicase
MTREEIQDKARKLAQTNNVLLLFSVRLGKTLTALNISRDFGTKHLIVTSEVLIIETIKNEIRQWGFDEDNYTIICYDSLHKYVDTSFDCVILDESEHITELNLSYLQTIKTKRWVGLCAKMSIDKKKLLRQLFPFIQYRVTYNEAVDAGILGEPTFYILDVYLDNVNKDWVFQRNLKKYAKNPIINCDFRDRFKYFNKPNNLNIRCTAQEYYQLLDENVEYNKKTFFQNRTDVFKNIWLQSGNNRKKWLGKYKTDVAKELIEWLREKESRFMVFCTDIKQCEELGRGDGITHSKNKNDDAIVKFNNNLVDELYVVDRGKEGITIYGIQEGLVIQCSGSDTANYQRAGRLAIAENPVIYVLRVKNTRDEDYVAKLKEDIDSKYIVEIDYREFKKQFYAIKQ